MASNDFLRILGSFLSGLFPSLMMRHGAGRLRRAERPTLATTKVTGKGQGTAKFD